MLFTNEAYMYSTFDKCANKSPFILRNMIYKIVSKAGNASAFFSSSTKILQLFFCINIKMATSTMDSSATQVFFIGFCTLDVIKCLESNSKSQDEIWKWMIVTISKCTYAFASIDHKTFGFFLSTYSSFNIIQGRE